MKVLTAIMALIALPFMIWLMMSLIAAAAELKRVGPGGVPSWGRRSYWHRGLELKARNGRLIHIRETGSLRELD